MERGSLSRYVGLLWFSRISAASLYRVLPGLYNIVLAWASQFSYRRGEKKLVRHRESVHAPRDQGCVFLTSHCGHRLKLWGILARGVGRITEQEAE